MEIKFPKKPENFATKLISTEARWPHSIGQQNVTLFSCETFFFRLTYQSPNVT